ncbi:PREDICTED: extensin-like [Bison bison bison]|uniref:Extensin-like n=1 Tax=Bison bison bison TaxID=43346 RepID=A0A6P3I8A6_BISBB|nr:PREDICTED: extensin-like [Bison bison bison]
MTPRTKSFRKAMRPAPKAHPCQPPGPQNPRPKALDATTHGPPASRPQDPQALDSTVPEPRAPDPKQPTPQPTPPSNRLHGASVPELPTPEHSTPRPHGPTAPKHPTRRSLAPECMVPGARAQLTEKPLPGTKGTRPTKPRTQPTKHPPSFRRAGTRPGVGNARSEAALSPQLWTAAAENPHQKRAFL